MVAPVKLLKQKINDDESSCPSILFIVQCFQVIKKLFADYVPIMLKIFLFAKINYLQIIRRMEAKRFYPDILLLYNY